MLCKLHHPKFLYPCVFLTCVFGEVQCTRSTVPPACISATPTIYRGIQNRGSILTAKIYAYLVFHTHILSPPPPMSNFCFFIATSTACICRCTLLLHRLAFHFDSTAAHEQARRVPLRHFEIVSLAGYLEKGDSAIRIMRGKNEKRVQEREFNRRNKCAS